MLQILAADLVAARFPDALQASLGPRMSQRARRLGARRLVVDSCGAVAARPQTRATDGGQTPGQHACGAALHTIESTDCRVRTMKLAITSLLLASASALAPAPKKNLFDLKLKPAVGAIASAALPVAAALAADDYQR